MTLSPLQEFIVCPQAKLIFDHMRTAGSISAREAMDDYNITSATLARRICDLEEVGVVIERARRKHPVSGRRYTRYILRGNDKGKLLVRRRGRS